MHSQVHSSGFVSLQPVSGRPTLSNSSAPLIAPYLLNLSMPNSGNVSYLLTNQTSLLIRFTSQVQKAFNGYELYSPNFLLIATWDGVGQSGNSSADHFVSVWNASLLT